MELDSHFSEANQTNRMVGDRIEEFAVLRQAGFQFEIRNWFTACPRERSVGAIYPGLRDSHGRTLAEQDFNSFLLVQLWQVLIEIPGQSSHFKAWISHNCSKCPPFLPQSVFLHHCVHLKFLLLHFSLKNFALV